MREATRICSVCGKLYRAKRVLMNRCQMCNEARRAAKLSKLRIDFQNLPVVPLDNPADPRLTLAQAQAVQAERRRVVESLNIPEAVNV